MDKLFRIAVIVLAGRGRCDRFTVLAIIGVDHTHTSGYRSR
jgi:hypothetical protein